MIINLSALDITVKSKNMKTMNLTKSEAIQVMGNILAMGCSIPHASDGQGGAGFDMIDPSITLKEASELWLKDDYDFRVVPASEISEEFKGNVDLDDYDVCVEFAKDGCRNQYLLWDIDEWLLLP